MVLNEYEKIMVAVDGSEAAELAFKKAVNIALRNKSTLYLVHVVDTHTFSLFPRHDRPINVEEYLMQLSTLAEDTLNTYREWAKNKGLTDVEIEMRSGSPKEEISKKVPQDLDIDLIVLGATGLSAMERVLVGSVSQYVIRNASCDVLIVRRENQHLAEERIVNLEDQ